ncbi:MAG: DEAD/DEAH box helicase [Gammaproteobacteria bacterium]|nr:DEAD/DEAH box helicase [Gammaproteobacteria bacterium]
MSTTKPFNKLGIAPALLTSLTELGYETPTPIQEQSIPVLMEGNDLLAQAQTGTGKTAAFALPILSHLDLAIKKPQALIIAPTRELAIQVAEAFQSYAKHLKGFHVSPIYGGQDYQIQLRALKRGAHVIVGTPGRLMDHLRRGTLSMSALKTIVLDEGDEMLKMGFIEDIQWILEQIPANHQTALFSATVPASIQQIAKRYMKDAKKIQITPKESTVDTIEQLYTLVSKNQKMDALTRFLEIEDIQAALVFTRTKTASAELAERLQARGYAAAALNGDMNQSMRKKTVDQIKNGTLDIVVATDVAARGLDIDRVSHVINFDIPYDTESYIHRIGRTGRAGRKGKAILFITPREHRFLNDIKRAIHMPIKQIEPPSLKEMSEKRSKQFAEDIVNLIRKGNKLKPYHKMVEHIMEQENCTAEDIAAALAYLSQQSNPLPSHEIEAIEPEEERPHNRFSRFKRKPSGGGRPGRSSRPPRSSKRRSSNAPIATAKKKKKRDR